jgi:hypothetical protein
VTEREERCQRKNRPGGAPAVLSDARHRHEGLDAKFLLKFYYAKRRFSITSKYRHMYGVLNVDKIKN